MPGSTLPPRGRLRPDHRLQVYRDIGRKWRWRKVSAWNGQPVATSNQDFANRWNAVRAALTANPEIAEADDEGLLEIIDDDG